MCCIYINIRACITSDLVVALVYGQNGDKPKRRHAKTATPKRRQTETATRQYSNSYLGLYFSMSDT